MSVANSFRSTDHTYPYPPADSAPLPFREGSNQRTAVRQPIRLNGMRSHPADAIDGVHTADHDRAPMRDTVMRHVAGEQATGDDRADDAHGKRRGDGIERVCRIEFAPHDPRREEG